MTSGTIANETNTKEIPRDEWIPFLAAFTRENRGAHARLEIVGRDTDVGYQVQTENRPFDGAAADVKDRERTVWIAFGSTPDDHITHAVTRAAAIRVLPPSENRGAVLEVEADDGAKSILELSNPEEYELPPPAR
jgi:Family of unknown function (DUF5335)